MWGANAMGRLPAAAPTRGRPRPGAEPCCCPSGAGALCWTADVPPQFLHYRLPLAQQPPVTQGRCSGGHGGSPTCWGRAMVRGAAWLWVASAGAQPPQQASLSHPSRWASAGDAWVRGSHLDLIWKELERQVHVQCKFCLRKGIPVAIRSKLGSHGLGWGNRRWSLQPRGVLEELTQPYLHIVFLHLCPRSLTSCCEPAERGWAGGWWKRVHVHMFWFVLPFLLLFGFATGFKQFFAGGAGGTAGARGCGVVGAGIPAPRLRWLKGKLPPEGRAVHRTV